LNLNDMEFQTPSYQTLAEQVAAALRDAVLTGKLENGAHLVETDLAEKMKVSRATIRESFRILGQQGLVKTYPRKGTFVTRMSSDEAAEVSTIRALLESHAASIAATRITPQDIEEFEAMIEDMAKAANVRNLSWMVDLDLRFHGKLCEMSGLKRLTEIWSILDSQIGAVIISGLESHNMTLDKLIERHENILQALKTKDPDLAAAAIKNHYRLPHVGKGSSDPIEE